MTSPVTQEEIGSQAEALLSGVPEGAPLTDLQRSLLRFALDVSATTLDVAAAADRFGDAIHSGATPDQLQEIVTLQAAIGVHSFFEGSRIVALSAGPLASRGPFDPARQELWDRHIGDRRYWIAMREEIPGFLESLLWVSPEAFRAFIDFAGLPYRTGHVDTLTKELIGMASDASVSHRYLPGMRMHLRTALRMGAGSIAIREALDIAAASSPPVGVA